MFSRIILLQIIFTTFVVNCVKQESKRNLLKNSESLENLYKKLKQNSIKPNELNAINKLTQIIADINDFENQMTEKQYNNSLLKSGLIDKRISNFVVNIVVNIAKVVDIRTLWYSLKEGISTSLTCLTCQSIVKIIFSRRFGAETLGFAFLQICRILNLSDYEVCEGYVSTFKDQINFIRQNTRLETTEICGLIMGDQCYSGQSLNLHWNVNIPKKLNQRNKNRDKSLRKRYDILHITDIHLDLDYVPNTGTDCQTPYCCRKNPKNLEPNISSNYWGSYPCDTPIQTLNNWVRNVDWNKIDWTYWTGDVVPHDSWKDSRFKSLQTSRIITNSLKTFSKNKLVVPAIGNHIAVPIGCFPPPLLDSDFNISWLFDELAEQWSHWLPNESLNSVRYGGYYALTVRPGFRIIVLNTNYCARLNIWTLYQSIDPGDHLKWLTNQLNEAEESGDLVHIVGHIPPDNRECTQSWLYNFMLIVERYSDIIVGQFYGHTHNDEFRVLYSVNNRSKAIGLEIISPSLTTYNVANPGYRIISTNRYGQIVDLNTFAFDLQEANSVYPYLPNWYHEYSMAQTYSINKFDGQDFDKIIKNIDSNDKYLQTFYTLSHRNSSFAKTICDTKCKSKIIYDSVIENPFIQKPKPIIESVINS